MPKLTGPLFSVQASGVLAGCLSYVNKAGQPMVRITPRSKPPLAGIAAVKAEQVSQLAASWRQQTPATKAAWKTFGTPRGKSGYRAWWEQWMLQSSTPENPPTIPG